MKVGAEARAYDWIDLKMNRVLNDELNGVPLTIVLQNDTASFHVWNRIVGANTLQFQYSDSLKLMIDSKDSIRMGLAWKVFEWRL
ncbi:MAG: hypothetical protein U5K54_24155 [Cytophagales bacterium]|nr:hypothetical protein [Cytophagales bacterium]